MELVSQEATHKVSPDTHKPAASSTIYYLSGDAKFSQELQTLDLKGSSKNDELARNLL